MHFHQVFLMAPKSADKGKAPSTSTNNQNSKVSRKRGNGTSLNMHGIKFILREQRERYDIIAKWIITPTRYNDKNTLTTQGTKDDIEMLFVNICLSYFTSLNQLVRKKPRVF